MNVSAYRTQPTTVMTNKDEMVANVMNTVIATWPLFDRRFWKEKKKKLYANITFYDLILRNLLLPVSKSGHKKSLSHTFFVEFCPFAKMKKNSGMTS